MPRSEAYIGLMSGTSMDGIDAVLVRFAAGRAPTVLATHTHSWPPDTLERLRGAAAGDPVDSTTLASLDSEAGEIFAQAALAVASSHRAPIMAIGSHGQTVAHCPNGAYPATLQLGNPAVIAERTGITTVADFRRRDIAAGGQGAPLVPAFHAAVFRAPDIDRAVVNIGGIANVTVLAADPAQPVRGFDTGPGNCLMDAWINECKGLRFDDEGRLAAAGTTDPSLLERLLADPYFATKSPKSTGTDYFSLTWLRRFIAPSHHDAADVQATLAALTARSIAEALRDALPSVGEVLVCGGGVHNRVLMGLLQDQLPCPVRSTASAGMDPDWIEAVAFAWLASRALERLPGNLPTVTGARGPRILGAIYPA